MARGYPKPKESEAPLVPALVPEGTCPICKRRPVAQGRTKCAPCEDALAGRGKPVS